MGGRPGPKRRYTRAALGLLLLCEAACSSSPGSFASRLTEGGRLLADGPPALMTASAVAASQAESVPLLYAFALETRQVPPTDGEPFPATSQSAQQLALLRVQDWGEVVLAGEGYIDAQCSRFLAALDELDRSKRATLANLNALQSATVGILGLAVAAQKSIGIVGIAFGLAASLVDNTASAVLYQLPPSAIRTVVKVQRDSLRQDENASMLAAIKNQGRATARLAEYLQYCVPVTIEANIARVLNNSVVTNAGAITVRDTPPAVTSAQAPVVAFPSIDDRRIPAVAAQTMGVVPAAVQRRKAALATAIRRVSDPAVLQQLADALGVPIPGGARPIEVRAALIRAMDAEAADQASMDRVAGRVAPIFGSRF